MMTFKLIVTLVANTRTYLGCRNGVLNLSFCICYKKTKNLKSDLDIIRTVYYIHGPELIKLILPCYMCD